MNWLDRLERKFGRFAIPNLMFLLVILMLVVFFVQFLFPDVYLARMLSLDRNAIFQGQVWRLLTFTMIPPNGTLLLTLLSLYFYYFIGSSLESAWGSFRFDFYYVCGIIGTIIAAMITGYASNIYLNFSLFLAFAMLFPDMQVLLFFIIPIKVKYLALVDALFFIVQFILGGWSTKVAILFCLLNFFLFFGGSFIRKIKQEVGFYKTRKNFRNSMKR